MTVGGAVLVVVALALVLYSIVALVTAGRAGAGPYGEYVKQDFLPPDPDRCVVDHYYTSGPVTPMSREEAEQDDRVMARVCVRGTRGCWVQHKDGGQA